jgi:hypothetical protein
MLAKARATAESVRVVADAVRSPGGTCALNYFYIKAVYICGTNAHASRGVVYT